MVALDAEVTRADNLARAWRPEAACLLIANALEITGARLVTYGATEVYDPSRSSLAALAYFRVGMTAHPVGKVLAST